MSSLTPVNINEFACQPFKLIGKDWMLITAENGGRVNTMTASWGGLGVIWNKNVAYIFVRKSRYTKEFIDNSDSFSLSFFDTEKHRKTLTYLGKVSGRNEDKIAVSGLNVEHEGHTPYFAEASTVLICKKLSCHSLSPEGFIDGTIDSASYKDKDYHDMYIGEITAILK